jgi:phosphatidylethanolamine/phosphatidyl-N-methylethanolamine N-methyltransferase
VGGVRNWSEWQAYRLFYAEFRRHFVTTGAIAPSGAALARAITAPLAAAPGPRRVLEAGAGTGVFTREILRHLEAGDTLDIYEINPVFLPWLERRKEQARIEARGIHCTVHACDLGLAPAEPRYDFIISGLPLNNFAPQRVGEILELLESRLRPGGVLSYFEYLYIRDLKRALVHDRAERARIEAVTAVVEGFLARHRHQAETVVWNLPPAVAHHVSQAAAGGLTSPALSHTI